jgi:2-aminoethylphosphonate-pyruvate transaminase
MYAIDRDPLLLTPGPLTTSLRTKQAMLHDWLMGCWAKADKAHFADGGSFDQIYTRK